MAKLDVLFVTPEAYPLIKVGGLGDISSALPCALRKQGLDVRVLMPAYPMALEILPQVTDTGVRFDLLPNIEQAALLLGDLPGYDTPVYLLDCPPLFRREGGPYNDPQGKDWPDNALRFAALAKAAALMGHPEIATRLGWGPALLHCNDWPAGLGPAYLKYAWWAPHPRSVMSIHNMAYQGLFSPHTLNQIALPQESFSMHGLEYNGWVSYLKAGLVYADHITTVSPTYAEEIQTAEFGYGLDGLMQQRQPDLTGILNGIDTQVWNPATDPFLAHHYDQDTLEDKQAVKRALKQRLQLVEDDRDRPLIGMITRLTHQKGVDLVLPIIEDLLYEGAQLAILGSGDRQLEQRLEQIARAFPGQVSVTIGYDESLSHQIEGGCDLYLMPSRFEPCGLNQLYSLRYGSIPVVRYTGGLADSVVDTTPANLDHQTATGFIFDSADSDELLFTLQRAMLVYRDKPTWRQIQHTGMKQDVSWARSAKQYIGLYKHVMAKP